jgi:hypothetical protein
MQCTLAVRDSPAGNAGVQSCTTRFENAHRTVLRKVLYRHHPWFGRRVCVHSAVDKDGFVVFRCTLEESQADPALAVPAWMFDRRACPGAELLATQPCVSIEALAAFSALVDLSSAVLLSGATGASHDQNRGEAHVTRDEKFGERTLTQSTIAPAESGRSVRERPVERRHRQPSWPELPAQAQAALTSLMTRLILDHAATTATTPRAK